MARKNNGRREPWSDKTGKCIRGGWKRAGTTCETRISQIAVNSEPYGLVGSRAMSRSLEARAIVDFGWAPVFFIFFFKGHPAPEQAGSSWLDRI